MFKQGLFFEFNFLFAIGEFDNLALLVNMEKNKAYINGDKKSDE